MLRALVLAMMLAAPGVADPRSDIQYQYDRSSEATRLKYLDGVYCIRSPRFRLFNSEGMPLNLAVERARWEQVIFPALKVDERVQILDFAPSSSEKVVCQAKYTTTLVTIDPLTDKQVTQILFTTCRDEWSRAKPGWRLEETRVTQQEFKR